MFPTQEKMKRHNTSCFGIEDSKFTAGEHMIQWNFWQNIILESTSFSYKFFQFIFHPPFSFINFDCGFLFDDSASLET